MTLFLFSTSEGRSYQCWTICCTHRSVNRSAENVLQSVIICTFLFIINSIYWKNNNNKYLRNKKYIFCNLIHIKFNKKCINLNMLLRELPSCKTCWPMSHQHDVRMYFMFFNGLLKTAKPKKKIRPTNNCLLLNKKYYLLTLTVFWSHDQMCPRLNKLLFSIIPFYCLWFFKNIIFSLI